MDFIGEVAAGNAPKDYPISVGEKAGTVYARRLTGAQKLALVRGKRYSFDGSTKQVANIEIDLGANEEDRHKMVLYAICDEKGKDRFKSLADVQVLPAELIEALYKIAKAHNANAIAPEDDPGEA